MIYSIENEKLKASIDSFGAEVNELIDKDSGVNYIHIKNPNVWKETSPVLFPLISGLKKGYFIYKKSKYEMPFHGFIKRHELEVFERNENSITFMYKDNEETLSIYPFHFEFYVTYSLVDYKLVTTFNIKNIGENKMYFMVGAHPGFKVPFNANDKYEDYYLEFERKETCKTLIVGNKYITNKKKKCLVSDKIIDFPKNRTQLANTYMFRHIKSDYVDLKSKNGGKVIRVYHSNPEILAFWANPSLDADFVCIEPWFGIQKRFVDNVSRQGVFKLKSNENKVISYTIEII